MGITRERVRQIKEKAIESLAAYLACQGLEILCELISHSPDH